MAERQTAKPVKIFKCKYCHVQVLGQADFRPVLGKEHAAHCPRHQKG